MAEEEVSELREGRIMVQADSGAEEKVEKSPEQFDGGPAFPCE